MELLERERYLADLAAWLHAAAESGGCIALVAGEAGIGKTMLLQEFAARQHGARVLWGACDALFTPRPLAPLHDIARQTQGRLWAAFSEGANRDAIFAAALDELEQGQPALVVFEDMHWADEATLDLLKFLGRRIHATCAMLAISYRDDEVGAHHPLRFVLGDLPRAYTKRMLLPPLSEAAVAQLATRAGRPSTGLHSVTGGNPLFVTEVLATEGDTVPVTVRDAVLARVVGLSAAARDIAELVCIVPGRAESWLLEQVMQLDEAGIEGCLSIGMLRDEEGSLAFRHELVRRALESSLSDMRLKQLHAKVLAILSSQADMPVARLAHHALGARCAADVLRYAPVAAAQAAAVGAHREAASHYEGALRYAGNLSPGERAGLQEKLSYECYLTDQIERAIEARRMALEIWRDLGARLNEGDALRWLSRLSWFAGRRVDANQYGTEAVDTLEPLPPGPELAMAYSNRAQLDMLAHETDSAIDWAQRTIQLAQLQKNDDVLCHALNNLGAARVLAGDDAGWADLEQSLRLALAGGFQEHAARAYTNMAYMAVAYRRYPQAVRLLSEGLAYCEKHDLDSWRLYMLAWQARMRFEQGDWNTASEEVGAVLSHSCTAPITRVSALTLLGHLRVRRGDPDADSPLREARRLASTTQELQRIGPLAMACAEAAWLAGDLAGVVREVSAAYALARQRHDPWMKGGLAVWLWRAEALSQPPTDIAEPHALELSGDWRGAARIWDALGCPYEHACLLARHGVESEQREAFTILERLGAAPAVLALRRQMRAQGVRGIPRGLRASTRRHPFGLTQREAEILGLLSDGLRNAAIAKRLFVSTKTVDHHVSSILMKLGVPSRAEAVAMVRQQSGQEPPSGRP